MHDFLILKRNNFHSYSLADSLNLIASRFMLYSQGTYVLSVKYESQHLCVVIERRKFYHREMPPRGQTNFATWRPIIDWYRCTSRLRNVQSFAGRNYKRGNQQYKPIKLRIIKVRRYEATKKKCPTYFSRLFLKYIHQNRSQ